MEVAARKLEETGVEQSFAICMSTDGRTCVVRRDGAAVRAQRATSCLVEPIAGDRLLVAHAPSGEAFVLAVLDRPSGGPATVSARDGLEVRTDGKLTLRGGEGVDVVSSAPVRVLTSMFRLGARAGEITFETLAAAAGEAGVDLGKAKVVARTLDSVMERLTERIGSAYRRVEEIDQVRARQIDHAAAEHAQVHGRTTIVSAEQLVKLNGEQIHVG